MRRIADYVWCDYYGSIHEHKDDPEQEGPQHVWPEDDKLVGNPLWLRDDLNDGYGLVWHFKCPGPHFKVWQGAGLP